MHLHEHDHEHTIDKTPKILHVHNHSNKTKNLTLWILFLVFVLGPCEPLIPLLMYPAAQASFPGLIAVTVVFALTTTGTMLAVFLLVNYGIAFIKTEKLEKYIHVIAGATIALSGVLILLGL
ncbi:MAG: sulfite exporter TauE/SafE family protein [Bacteroidales bacterium]|nr:sulfite exporter TauE/SafE family protein [Bacteroidales bacterium]